MKLPPSRLDSPIHPLNLPLLLSLSLCDSILELSKALSFLPHRCPNHKSNNLGVLENMEPTRMQ